MLPMGSRGGSGGRFGMGGDEEGEEHAGVDGQSRGRGGAGGRQHEQARNQYAHFLQEEKTFCNGVIALMCSRHVWRDGPT